MRLLCHALEWSRKEQASQLVKQKKVNERREKERSLRVERRTSSESATAGNQAVWSSVTFECGLRGQSCCHLAKGAGGQGKKMKRRCDFLAPLLLDPPLEE